MGWGVLGGIECARWDEMFLVGWNVFNGMRCSW